MFRGQSSDLNRVHHKKIKASPNHQVLSITDLDQKATWTLVRLLWPLTMRICRNNLSYLKLTQKETWKHLKPPKDSKRKHLNLTTLLVQPWDILQSRIPRLTGWDHPKSKPLKISCTTNLCLVRTSDQYLGSTINRVLWLMTTLIEYLFKINR